MACNFRNDGPLVIDRGKTPQNPPSLALSPRTHASLHGSLRCDVGGVGRVEARVPSARAREIGVVVVVADGVDGPSALQQVQRREALHGLGRARRLLLAVEELRGLHIVWKKKTEEKRWRVENECAKERERDRNLSFE